MAYPIIINNNNNNYDYNDYFSLPFQMLITIDNTTDIDYIMTQLYYIIIFTSIFFGSVFISIFIYVNLSVNSYDYLAEELDEDNNDNIDYKNKYMEQYKELDDNEIDKNILQGLKDVFIEEESPDGKIIMNYDSSLECFTYYTNKKDIPYDYLETVARYYIIKNNCKNIFIDYQYELNKSKQIVDEKNKEKEIEEEKNIDISNNEIIEKKNVFATLKKYNNDEKKIKKNIKEYLTVEKSNKYIYKGKLLDYELLYNCKDTSDFENIDYNTFKKNL